MLLYIKIASVVKLSFQQVYKLKAIYIKFSLKPVVSGKCL